MNFGYTNTGNRTVHKTKTSTPFFKDSKKKFKPECDRNVTKSKQIGEIDGYVVTREELMIRCNKKGLKVRQCKRKGCFDSIFDSW